MDIKFLASNLARMDAALLLHRQILTRTLATLPRLATDEIFSDLRAFQDELQKLRGLDAASEYSRALADIVEDVGIERDLKEVE